MPSDKPPRTPRSRAATRVELDRRLIGYIEEPQGVGKEIWEKRRLKNRLRRFFRKR